jgi:speckle-type POZ protein
MFQLGFLRSKTRIVIITDIEMEVFKEMLNCMYTGKAPSGTEVNFTKSLYEAADKYFVEPLKSDCTNILVSQLIIKNAMEQLVWAEFQSIPEFFNKAINLIVENCNEFCFRPELLEFITNHTKLSLPI